MLQLSQIVLSLPWPSYLQHGTPAIVLGHIAVSLTKWTVKVMRPTTSSPMVLPPISPSTTTLPLKPTPTVPLQVESGIPISFTMSAASVCLALVLATFCILLRRAQRLSRNYPETPPPLFVTPVEASDYPSPPIVSWVSQVRSFLKLCPDPSEFYLGGVVPTLGRFRMLFFPPRSSSRFFWSHWMPGFPYFFADLPRTFLFITKSALGWVSIFLKRQTPDFMKGASCPTPGNPVSFTVLALVISFTCRLICDPGSSSVLYLLVALEPVLAASLLAGSWLWHHKPTTMGKMSLAGIGIHSAAVCWFAACAVAACLLNRYCALNFDRGFITWIRLSPAVEQSLVQLVIVVVSIISVSQLVDRLVVFPLQNIATYHRLRVLANGQVHREIKYEKAGIRGIKTIYFLFFIYIVDTALFWRFADRILPGNGLVLVALAHTIIIYLRAVTWYLSDIRKILPPIGRIPELIIDPRHDFNFVILGGDEMVDEADGGQHADNVERMCWYNEAIDEVALIYVEPKGIG